MELLMDGCEGREARLRAGLEVQHRELGKVVPRTRKRLGRGRESEQGWKPGLQQLG